MNLSNRNNLYQFNNPCCCYETLVTKNHIILLQSEHVITDCKRSYLQHVSQRFDICGLQGGFTLEKGEQQCNDYIRRTVGRDKIVLMLVNGGVGSADYDWKNKFKNSSSCHISESVLL
ncbi:hypothetical protein OUZ56_021077 [Daphnia magna]|uniref:GMP synthase n=1 Tax=Daphnia magna TaxID=35525 RepID=A0ABQ9ZGF4_9CRUS|nr:hypothetical protein OUZ56_021077 [Daphnia magna]